MTAVKKKQYISRVALQGILNLVLQAENVTDLDLDLQKVIKSPGNSKYMGKHKELFFKVYKECICKI